MGEKNRDIISVIVPIFNSKEYLSQCVNSILNQTYGALEVILVDDGSTDGSSEICDEYARIDDRIRAIHKDNEGPVIARKVGLNLSCGKYIIFVDSDDWLEPKMLDILYRIIVENDVDVSMCGRFEDTGEKSRQVLHGIPAGRYDKHQLIEKVYPNMIVNDAFFEWGIFPGLWDKLFRKEVVEKHILEANENIYMGDDAACVYPCLLDVDSIYITDSCLYHYRQSMNSIVKSQKDINLERRRFHTLYYSVKQKFEEYTYVYDMRNQWKEYILFLMTPRAGTLYQGIDELEYLFPFPKVKKGSDIVIYGMGTYGQLLYRFVSGTNVCNVVACADRNYIELRKQGLHVISPDEISTYQYDYIVVANSFAKVRATVYKELAGRYPYEKIQLMDEDLIKSEESLRAFGLLG